ncbi:hypothetical protein Tco_1548846 [Tanacetum coccineum]
MNRSFQKSFKRLLGLTSDSDALRCTRSSNTFKQSFSNPSRIAETNFDPKEAIRLIKKLLYDNSSPRPPEELNSENDFEKDNSGSTTILTDISLPEYESFGDENDSAFEIFNDDLAHIISTSEYEYVYADDESDSGDSTRKLQMSHRGHANLGCSVSPFLSSLTKSSMGDRVRFKTRLTKISASREATHVSVFCLFSNKCDVRGLASSNLVFLLSVMICQDYQDYEDSCARGFVQCSLGLHSFACLFWESYILSLID